jgi:hypothetical protein
MSAVRGLIDTWISMGWWLLAVLAAAAPRRLWPHLEPPLPLRSAAPVSGLLTAALGFALSVGGFFEYAARAASERNAALLRLVAEGRGYAADQLSLANYGASSVVLFEFLFFTPLGLFAMYLSVSGSLRGFSAWFDDPSGDFILSGLDWAAATVFTRNREERKRIARERREGPETPDRLFTGEWAGVDADYVVVASRRKQEWEPGAIIMTSTDWYRLGVPFDLQTPAGTRTAYPLKKLDAVEVVRRGIQYELPRLRNSELRSP